MNTPCAFPFDREPEDYHGHSLFRFPFHETEGIVVVPREARSDRAWLWKAFYFDAFSDFEIAMLDEGFHLVLVRSPSQYPVPSSIAKWDLFYDFLTRELGFPEKAALFGLSRGGWYLYRWASQNPDKVHCLYADNPMCDLVSVYYGRGAGERPRKPDHWRSLLKEFGWSENEALAGLSVGPLSDLDALAKANVPILHTAATDDEVVPYAENTELLAKKYRQLGGKIEVLTRPGRHHPHGLDDPSPVMAFIRSAVTRDDGRERIEA